MFEWENGVDFPVALPDNLKIHEQPVGCAIEICEQSAILVCSVAVEAEVYGFTAE